MHKNKKILFFISSINIGGVEKVMVDYANLLYKDGYEIHYVVMHPIVRSGSFVNMISSGIKIYTLNCQRIRNSIFRLRKIVKNIKPDIIITENERVLSVVAVKFLIPFSPFKIIETQHSFFDNAELRHAKLSLVITKFCANFCYKIIAVSKSIASMLKEQIHISPNKIVTIYNPIDINRIKALASTGKCDFDNFILFVGRLSVVKNIPLLINAFNILHRRFPTIRLVIIGEGEERIRIKRMIENLRLSEYVTMLGSLNNPYPYILKSKLVVIPSTSEGLSLVILESLLLGKTIVSTPHTGAKELLSANKLGYVSKSFNDPAELAELMETAINHPIPKQLLTNYSSGFDTNNKAKEITSMWQKLN